MADSIDSSTYPVRSRRMLMTYFPEDGNAELVLIRTLPNWRPTIRMYSASSREHCTNQLEWSAIKSKLQTTISLQPNMQPNNISNLLHFKILCNDNNNCKKCQSYGVNSMPVRKEVTHGGTSIFRCGSM